ncbi:ester cyclase [Arenibacter sp. BSSL-BM3]|uniref:Ester cyclase n=1 Tax=Arenibacter arenosicollis TaxID=2762274 RepID=A0ABR7QRS8_9FLAO|nr:ester cyclase [Arenibacter arenosicollis]MBC8769891.1 ester cyclase [Arenibacter arenosicollis]
MNKNSKNQILSILLLALLIVSCKSKQSTEELSENTTSDQIESTSSKSEKEIKVILERILAAVGNRDAQELDDLSFDQAIIAYTYPEDGQWQHKEMTIDSYLQNIRDMKDPKPILESANSYKINITEDRLASVIMPTVISKFGVASSNEVNHAIMMKDSDQWKLLSISWTAQRIPEEEKEFDLNLCARNYAQVWGSNRPEFVAMFYAEDGSLQVNDGEPAVGRNAITNVAKGFLDAFPDMIVSMDSLVTKSNKKRFYWTLTGTNDVPNGTGKKVKISGFEEWTLNDDGLIQESKGYFDEKEYERQLEFGTDK